MRSKTCASGRKESATADESNGRIEQPATTFETKFDCVSIAPLGSPVVPEV